MKKLILVSVAAIITSLIALSIAMYLNNFPVKSECNFVITDKKADSISWISDTEFRYINNNNLYQGHLADCDINSQRLKSPKGFLPKLICESSNKIILQKKNLSYVWSGSNKTKIEKNIFPIFCNKDYLVFIYSTPEPTFEYYIYKFSTHKTKHLNTDYFTYTYIPKTFSSGVSFIANDNPGVYYNKKLILKAEEFGYWDITEDTIYYTKTEGEETHLYIIDTLSKKSKKTSTLELSPQKFIEISPNKKWLITGDLGGEVIFQKL